MLEEDEELRRDGTGSEELFQAIAKQLREAGVAFSTGFQLGSGSACGLSDREMQKLQESIESPLAARNAALARGDVSFIQDELDELLERSASTWIGPVRLIGSSAWRSCGDGWRHFKLSRNVNRARSSRRPGLLSLGTMNLPQAAHSRQPRWLEEGKAAHSNDRQRVRAAARRFTELHGDLPVADITRRHVREFREALQSVPRHRAGALRTASLPQLVEWSRNHRDAEKISAATVNKLLGGVQAVAVWGRDNGLIPEDKPWADPFSRMRLEEEEILRAPGCRPPPKRECDIPSRCQEARRRQGRPPKRVNWMDARYAALAH